MGRELVTAARRACTDLGIAAGDLVFIDDDPDAKERGLSVVTLDSMRAGDRFIVAVGTGNQRRRLEERCLDRGLIPFDMYADSAQVGPRVAIEAGAVLCAQTILTTDIRIGRQFQCNVYSCVMHDCVIGDYVTFAPRVTCNGNVFIGDYAYVGAGALIKNGTPDKPLRIGEGAVIGMGAVVTRDVPAGAVVVGNPARVREG